jgi:hypothetical protein
MGNLFACYFSVCPLIPLVNNPNAAGILAQIYRRMAGTVFGVSVSAV